MTVPILRFRFETLPAHFAIRPADDSLRDTKHLENRHAALFRKFFPHCAPFHYRCDGSTRAKRRQ
jgi:hypothetical protein